MTAKQVEEMTGQRRALLVVNHVCDLRSAQYRRIALAIGVFDGVHRGHQKLLQTLAELAAATGAKPVALTFHPHPRALLKPQEKPLLLLPLANRVELLHQYGAQAVVVKKFDQELATLSPQAFLDALLSIPELEIAGICVGSAWRFGHGGGGDCRLLAGYAAERRFRLEPVPELAIDGEIVSSSNIRRAVAAGRFSAAAAMLGRPFSLYGKVEHGHRLAGTALDHPTANLAVTDTILPPDGVYAARVNLEEGCFPAAVNIGVAPTFRYTASPRRVEVHVLDFHGNLYDASLQVELLQYLREERCFISPEELKKQIESDIKAIRRTIEIR